MYGYLSLINMYNLLDDTTSFIKFAAFSQTIINIPWSLCMDFFFRVTPNVIVPALYLAKGTALLAYGIVMNIEGLEPWPRLVIGYVVTIPLHLASNFSTTYLDKHLMICLSKKHDVKLGVLNSARAMLGSVTHSVQILIVGQVRYH